ncbi:hypothetical protein JTB14_010688 [Gonioctena quinquepunctata]|nr:hypothetical protein JTB14_010688 [Gonioctena quinquepunctata]
MEPGNYFDKQTILERLIKLEEEIWKIQNSLKPEVLNERGEGSIAQESRAEGKNFETGNNKEESARENTSTSGSGEKIIPETSG